MCRDYGKVLCIHTGAGDSEIRLATARPALLQEFLNHPAVRGSRVCLVHSGYPWVGEAAFMANAFDCVYLDYSLGVPFSSFGANRLLRELLEIAPVTRILHGSDGFNLPEINWLAAHLARAAIGELLGRLVADGFIRAAYAIHVARRILGENARELYRGPLSAG